MLKAILFDLDGTLVNTDPLHYQSWQEILRDYGMEIDRIFYKAKISGRLNPLIIQDLYHSYRLRLDANWLTARKHAFEKLL
jgi:beta-phosphoglucomutase